VRAIAQVSGMTLATAMAAADTIEQADDRAKVRVLEVLGIQTATPSSFQSFSPAPPLQGYDYSALSSPPPPEPTSSSSDDPITKSFDPTPPQPIARPLIPTADSEKVKVITPSASAPLELSSANSATPAVADLYAHFTLKPNLDTHLDASSELELPESTKGDYSFPAEDAGLLTTTKADDPPDLLPISLERNSKPSRLKDPSTVSDPVAIAAPTDLSDVKVQISTEMMRLNWNTTQGKEHLKRTYGKRSRQELTETELYDFLSYLQTQP